MNILYIAYSCSPNHGSEDRVGWKIPLVSSKFNRVYVLTKEEHRAAIQEYLDKNPECKIQFFYVDIPSVYKKLFKGPSYAGRLNIWQKQAVEYATKLCQMEKIDLIHQITPIEFRSIGDYGRIQNVKYVCGPIGGAENVVKGLEWYAKRHFIEELLRQTINRFGRHSLKKRQVLERCDALIYINEETKAYLKDIKKGGEIEKCMVETGIDLTEIRYKNHVRKEKCILLVAGRMVYRKGHALLLDALYRISKKYDYECHFVGTGAEYNRLKKQCESFHLLEKVIFHGRVGFEEMASIYEQADVLIMPSLRETTGSVLLEAMAKGLPVITMKRFGGKTMLNMDAGWFYDGDSKEQILKSLEMSLIKCLSSVEEREEKAERALTLAKNNIWELKMKEYSSIYEQLLQIG